jgi:hypothetical protein
MNREVTHDGSCVVHRETLMKAITARKLPPAVVRAVKEKAREENLSLNRAIVAILEEATGFRPGRRVLHLDLDHLAGRWSDEEYGEFMEALREQRQVDPAMWR